MTGGGGAVAVAGAQAASATADEAKPAKRSKSAARRAGGYSSQVVGTTTAKLLTTQGRLYRGDRSSLSYWSDTGAEPVTRVLPSANKVTAMSVTPDGKSLGVAQADGWISVWDHELTQDPWKRRFGTKAPDAIALGEGFVAFSQAGSVQLANTSSGKVFKKISIKGPVRSLFFAPGMRDVLLAFGADELEVIDVTNRKALEKLPLGGDIVRAYPSPQGKQGVSEIWIEYDQGDSMVRRSYRLARPTRDGAVQLSLVDTDWTSDR